MHLFNRKSFECADEGRRRVLRMAALATLCAAPLPLALAGQATPVTDATAALLRLQAAAWALAPALDAVAADAAPHDAFAAEDVFTALTFVLGAGPTPLRLLMRAPQGPAAVLPAAAQGSR
jgi:hypothetical protein